jgi:hypothetical protein
MRFLPILPCLLVASCALPKKEDNKGKFTIFQADPKYATKPSENSPADPSQAGLETLPPPPGHSIQGDLRMPDVLGQMPDDSEFRSNPGQGNSGIIVKPPQE